MSTSRESSPVFVWTPVGEEKSEPPVVDLTRDTPQPVEVGTGGTGVGQSGPIQQGGAQTRLDSPIFVWTPVEQPASTLTTGDVPVAPRPSVSPTVAQQPAVSTQRTVVDRLTPSLDSAFASARPAIQPQTSAVTTAFTRFVATAPVYTKQTRSGVYIANPKVRRQAKQTEPNMYFWNVEDESTSVVNFPDV